MKCVVITIFVQINAIGLFDHIMQPHYVAADKNLRGTLMIPAMDNVRLEVRDTSRNSEKLRPKANKPPIHNVNNEYRKGGSSVTRNNLSEVLSLSPGNKRDDRLHVSVCYAGTMIFLVLKSFLELYKVHNPEELSSVGRVIFTQYLHRPQFTPITA